MNTSDVLAKIGRDAPLPMRLDSKDYGLWFQLMAPYTSLSDDELAKLDIGQLNMECALGLPGAENLTLDAIYGYCEKLNDWAAQIRDYTKKHETKFRRRPWEYNSSFAYFRMLCLATYLCKNLGVRYNMAFMEGDYDASDSRNLLLHGLMSGHGGTCVTMPILYIAIGRRLGYPLKLVNADQHCFVRWDEPNGERLNIESTSPGLNTHPDSYYRYEWPKPISDEQMATGHFLRSLHPREELVHALTQRTMGFVEHLRFGDALLSCYLIGRLVEHAEDATALGLWSTTTIAARSLEEARKRAGFRNYDYLDLRTVTIAEPGPPMKPWAAEHAREWLDRLAGNREKRRAAGAAVPSRINGEAKPRARLSAAARFGSPVDMTNPADVLDKLGFDWPGPVTINRRECGPWFRMMSDATLMPDEELGSQDIGSWNLKAAVGLPGAESMCVDDCVQTLNAWSKRVRAFTEEHGSDFERSPEKFNNSQARFRMASLATVLQDQFDVRFDPGFSADYNATDSGKLFVHGVLSGRAGTLATLPVLYVAVGRRLKYPLKLVRAKNHLFARWDEPNGERFNIECAAVGFSAHDDDHFRRFPVSLTDTELESGFYLRSLRPDEELAEFLSLRAECLIDNLRPVEALQSAFLAAQMCQGDPWLQRSWCVTTIIARALEAARVKADQTGYDGLDLRDVCIGDGKSGLQRFIQIHIERIARIQERARRRAKAVEASTVCTV